MSTMKALLYNIHRRLMFLPVTKTITNYFSLRKTKYFPGKNGQQFKNKMEFSIRYLI